MRKFLYSRWFFLFLVVSCSLDLLADLAEDLWKWTFLNHVALLMDAVILVMAAWMFIDLQRRRPKNGGNSRR
jgi:hypothetical protein